MYNANNLGLIVMGNVGKEQICLCPFHNDSNASATFDTLKGLFFCFSCNKGYNYNQLCKKLDIDEHIVNQCISLPLLNTVNNAIKEPLSFEAIGYLKSRKLNDVEIENFYQHDNYVGVDVGKGSLLRKFAGKGSRYKKEGSIFLYPNKKFKPNETILFVEGIFSCIKLRRLNSNTYSICGSNINKNIEVFAKQYKHLFIFDNDVAGVNGCNKAKRKGLNAMISKIELDESEKLNSYYEKEIMCNM